MAMHQIRGLLSLELAATYDGEQRLLPMLALQARQSRSGEAHAFFVATRLETEHHVDSLRGCFALLGEPVPVRTNHAVDGLVRQREAFLLLDPTSELLLAHDLVTALHVAHLSVASYTGLVRLAHLVHEARVALLLSESLRQEQRVVARAARLLELLVRPPGGMVVAAPGRRVESVPIPRAVEPEVHRRRYELPRPSAPPPGAESR